MSTRDPIPLISLKYQYRHMKPASGNIVSLTLATFKKGLEKEAAAILSWWEKYMKDERHGGYYGKMNNTNTAFEEAPKGIVLNSRILWSFSAAYNQTQRREWLPPAQRVFEYINRYFTDADNGGVYWSVDASGRMLDGKKQIYGQAFCIYGLAEYFIAVADETALRMAKALFYSIEKYSLDNKNGGYLEAFSRSWGPLEDRRLSEKDDNEAKSMNTHLHVLEAYTNLYRAWKNPELLQSIQNLLDIFNEKIIDGQTGHQRLFFDERWVSRSPVISFGHDIEAAWLLQEAAEIAGTPSQKEIYRRYAITMADAAARGLDADGGLWHEHDPVSGHWVKEKHWWPQAEAMVGFFNAWQLSRNEKYLHYALNSWDFIKKYIRDEIHGEWIWGINPDYSIMDEDKAGFWKCPYHNTRACLEIVARINK